MAPVSVPAIGTGLVWGPVAIWFLATGSVVQGVVLIVAIGFLMLNLLADVLYVLINPKMRG